MLVIAVEPGPSFRANAPRVLFTGAFIRENRLSGASSYDVAGDGQRFVMMTPIVADTGSTGPLRMTVVLNWYQELLERVPVD